MCPGIGGVALLGFRPLVGRFDGAARTLSTVHSESGMTSLSVVKDLQVVEDGVGQLDARLPAFAVE
jgi:hypothetical protein